MIFRDAQWFHYTGITPAISQGAADVCLQAIDVAAQLGITISGDINYRRNLWQYGKQAIDIMPALMEKTNVMIAASTDLENCAGIRSSDFQQGCEKAFEKFPSLKWIASTDRESISSSHNIISGQMMRRNSPVIESRKYDINPIVDRVGSGDAFMAGLIFGSITGKNDNDMLEFASAASVLKHTIEGDFNLVSADEVEQLVKGENVGKLLR
jgi:2-dehydro-3-deoxygluconokinase